MKVLEFKKIFLQRREELLQKIAKKENIQLESSDETDYVQNSGIKRTYEALCQRDQEALHKINIALCKIDKGVFGVCEECGDPISSKRLEAIPDCRLCISCAESEELQR